MSNVVPIYYCSFCGKDDEKIEFIFVAYKEHPGSPSICSECTELVMKKLSEKRLEVITTDSNGDK